MIAPHSRSVPVWVVAVWLLGTPAVFAQRAEPDASTAWNRFRGPNGTGIADAAGIPVQWTAKDYRWRVELPGVGHSSPVVCGDRIFVTCANEIDGLRIACCLRATDGQTMWARKFPGTTYKKNVQNSYAASTPAVDEEHVYLSLCTPEQYLVVALEQGTGREVWRHDLGPFEAEHGFGSSPVLFGDVVIAVNEQNGPSSVVALDRKSGKVRWQTPRKPVLASYSTPFVYQPEQGPPQLILSSRAHGISSIDPTSGKANWDLPVFNYRIVGSPMEAGGLIFASGGTGGAGRQMFAVRPGDPVKGTRPEVAYEIKPPIPYVPTSVTDGRLLFFFCDGGIAGCLEAASGKVFWTERLGKKFFASPIRVGDRIYCPSREGEMIVLAAAEKYQLLARFELGETTHATPAVSGGAMYVRTLSHLAAVGQSGAGAKGSTGPR